LVEKRQCEPIPPLLGAHVRGALVGILPIFMESETKDPVGLSYSVLSVIPGSAIVVQLRLVADGQTDGRTDRQTDKHTMTANTALAQRHVVKTIIKLADIMRSCY